MLRQCTQTFLLALFPAVFSIVVATSSEAEQSSQCLFAGGQALDLMQKDALHRASINWARIRAETFARAANVTRVS